MKTCADWESFLYLTDDELSPSELNKLVEHLNTCSECRSIRDQVIKSRSLLVGIPEDPGMDIPDFTGMARDLERPGKPTTDLSGRLVFRVIRWTSVIAASLLVLLFLSEQNHTVRKIVALEETMSGLVYPDTPGLVDQWAFRESAHLRASLNEVIHSSAKAKVRITPFNLHRIQWAEALKKSNPGWADTRVNALNINNYPVFYRAFIIHSKTSKK